MLRITFISFRDRNHRQCSISLVVYLLLDGQAELIWVVWLRSLRLYTELLAGIQNFFLFLEDFSMECFRAWHKKQLIKILMAIWITVSMGNESFRRRFMLSECFCVLLRLLTYLQIWSAMAVALLFCFLHFGWVVYSFCSIIYDIFSAVFYVLS